MVFTIVLVRSTFFEIGVIVYSYSANTIANTVLIKDSCFYKTSLSVLTQPYLLPKMLNYHIHELAVGTHFGLLHCLVTDRYITIIQVSIYFFITCILACTLMGLLTFFLFLGVVLVAKCSLAAV